MNAHRAGFTFWQIAAVLAVFLAVAAILFPLFQKVRERPHHESCQSNLKIFGLVYTEYLQDNDEKYPPSVNAAGSGWAGKIYPFIKATIYPFTKATDVYKCPNDTTEGQHISYAQNQALTGQPLAALANPIYTVELYEFTTLNCDPSTPETVSATGLAAPQDSKRHSDQDFRLNFLAADGHVKMLKPGQVSSGPSAVSPQKRGAFVMTFAVK